MTDFDELGAPGTASHFEPISVSDESTVVAEFVPESADGSGYQSEAELEMLFVELLQSQAYEYLPITSTAALEANLRTQLQALNKFKFTDVEWQRFFAEQVSAKNDGIVEKTARIQTDHRSLAASAARSSRPTLSSSPAGGRMRTTRRSLT